MTLPTPSELPHLRCRQFCYRVVYRPSFSLGFKKANGRGVCRRFIPAWWDTPARFTFLVPFLSPLRGLGSTSPGYRQAPESWGHPGFLWGSGVPVIGRWFSGRSFVESAGRPAALSRRHPSGSRPDAAGPGTQEPGPIPTSSRPAPRQYRTPFTRRPSYRRDITDLISRLTRRDARPCLTQGTGEREIPHSEPVRPAIPKDATAVPAAPGGRSQPRHKIDRRSDGLIRILSGDRRPLAVSLYSRSPYSTVPPRPSWSAPRCVWRPSCRGNVSPPDSRGSRGARPPRRPGTGRRCRCEHHRQLDRVLRGPLRAGENHRRAGTRGPAAVNQRSGLRHG